MRVSVFLDNAHIKQAENILKRKNITNPEEKIQELKELLGKENKKYLPLAAFFYQPDRINFQHIIKDFLSLSHLFSVNVSKQQVKINYRNKEYLFDSSNDSWIRFEHLIHAIQAERQEQKRISQTKANKNAGKLIIKKNNIEIRLARDVWDAISLGRGTGFCISQPGTPHFNIYRLNRRLTTYFIFDDNFSPKHPLHIVVYMVPENNGKPLLTDLKNTTGKIQHPKLPHKERGDYAQEYIRYLKEKGIPVEEKLVPQPLSSEEEEIIKKFEKPIYSLEKFWELSAQDKINYISMGHKLRPNQLHSLIKHIELHPYDYPHIKLLHHYLYTGIPLFGDYIPILKGLEYNKTNLLKHYLKYRLEAHNAMKTHPEYWLTREEYQLLPRRSRKQVTSHNNQWEACVKEKFDINKIKEMISKIKDPYKTILLLNYLLPHEQIQVYDYLISSGKFDRYFYPHLSNIRHYQVLQYILEKLENTGLKFPLPISVAETLSIMPQEYRKRILQKQIYLNYNDSADYNTAPVLDLLFNTFENEEEIISWIKSHISLSIGYSKSLVQNLIHLLSSCCRYPCTLSWWEKCIQEIIEAIPNISEDHITRLSYLIQLPCMPEKLRLKLISQSHPAIDNAVLDNLLTIRENNALFFDSVPDFILIRAIDRYGVTKPSIISGLLYRIDYIFRNKRRPQLESYLIQQAFQYEQFAAQIIHIYFTNKNLSRIAEAILDRMPKEAPSLFKDVLQLLLRYYRNQYIPLINYYINRRNAEALHIIIPQDISGIYQIIKYTDEIISLVQYAPLHRWLVEEAIPSLLQHEESSQKAWDAFNKIGLLSHRFLGPPEAVAKLIIRGVQKYGFFRIKLNYWSQYRFKDELFRIIKDSNQLSQEELDIIAQKLELNQ